jgi:hypothetical protein
VSGRLDRRLVTSAHLKKGGSLRAASRTRCSSISTTCAGCDRDDRFVVGKRHCREFALRGALQGQELPVCPLRAPTVRVRSESVDAIW